MKAPDILRKSIEILLERGTARDVPGGEKTIASVVKAFNALRESTGSTHSPLTATEGWLFMVLVKVRRAMYGAYVADDFVDGAGYFSLAGQQAAEDDKEANDADAETI